MSWSVSTPFLLENTNHLLWYSQEYIKEKYIQIEPSWNTFLSIYPERNVQLYRNHPRRDLYQLWKWLHLGSSVWSSWNLAEIFQQECTLDSESVVERKDLLIDEAWTELSTELTRLGFHLSNEKYMIRTAVCLWIFLKEEGSHLGCEERSELARLSVLLQCSSEPKGVLKRKDVLSRLSSCGLLLLALISFQSLEDIKEYYRFLVSYCKEHFRLDWVCLSYFGNEIETEKFLQTYLDATGDIQLVSILSLLLLTRTSLKMSWISEYRRILEQLCQWERIVELNSFCTSNMDNVYAQSIFQDRNVHLDAICYFCNKSLVHVPFGTKQNTNSLASFQSSWRVSSLNYPRKYELHRVHYCPWCKKELPKCSVCLFHLSCWNPAYDSVDSQYSLNSSDVMETNNNLFTWCVHCRHASHVDHILSWFHPQFESTCPVSGCSCPCMSLDS
ncbi:hypothetical protein GpartN1_g6160.t1 [Galdieria partita]|uniref:GATOR2 complex protein MIO zinc-ribbon like domain-containing protein n=1 Tax=Galdieria partita TaxID=83374 RepID=A0A9C7Q146_9RHOD|nr:hypothetical protein GpartN1_g6160.t1 [Galdieria partita]